MSKVVDDAKPMADDDQTGGIVTTVRKATTSDLDVLKQIEDSKAADEAEKPKEVEKPAESVEDEKFDRAKLSPVAQKEFDRQAAERRREKQRREELELEVDRLKAGTKREAPAPEPTAKQLTRPTRPDPTKFDDNEKFAAAEAKYEDDLYDYRKAIDTQKEAEARQVEADRAVIASFNDRTEAFKADHPDYEEVMDTSLALNETQFGAMLKHGPALGYWFATHPDETKAQAKMSRDDMIEDIVRVTIELKSEARKAKPAAETTLKVKSDPPGQVGGRKTATDMAPAKKREDSTFKDREKEYAKRHPGALNYQP